MTRPTHIITETPGLLSAIERWRHEPTLGVDTEGNSFFAYRDRICLVQISTREEDWIVDPLAVDLAPLSEVMSAPGIEKIFHASEYDVTALRRDHGFSFANLFDTHIAAKAVGHRKVGLGNLLEELLAVKLAKDEQRSDWGRRPLSANQLEYAFSDTRYLPALADALKAKVHAAGEFVEAEVAVDCKRMAEREWRQREIDPDRFERHPLSRKLDPVSRQILKTLYEVREQRAEAMDKPVFRVVSDETLGQVALRKPLASVELQKITGITPVVLARYGEMLLSAVQDGISRGPLPIPRRQSAPIDVALEERFDALRAWRKTVADARGVEVEVIAGNAALKALAAANPTSIDALLKSQALDPLRAERYGAAMLGVLHNGQK